MSYTDPQIGTLTISGDPARFVATERVPVSGLSMDFSPVQDLHGYDYPWPAGGGKNLFETTATTKTENGVTWTINDDGSISASGTPTGYSVVVAGKAEVTSELGTINISISDIAVENNLALENIQLKDSNGTNIAVLAQSVTPFTQLSIDLSDYPDVASITVQIKRRTNNIAISALIKIQVETGSTATAWTPYSNICPITGRDSVNVYVSPVPVVVDGTEEYEIEFGQTVYAGALTINEDGSGQIVSKMASVDMGTLTWTRNQFSSSFYYFSSAFQSIAYGTLGEIANMLCEIYKPVNSGTQNLTESGTITNYTSNNLVLVRDDAYTDAVTFAGAMNGVQLVYELAEPVTLQLDPIEITTLIGLNYVWTSDHNLITISFPYNKEVQPMALNYDHCWTYPKAYIDKLEARIAALETAAAAASAEANTAAAPAETRETVAEEITVTEEPETEPVTKKGGK